jgi:hypothetical protein
MPRKKSEGASYPTLFPFHAHLTQCDELEPACRQCTRLGKDCPGYRDQLSLMFLDESKAVARKAKHREAKGESTCQTVVRQSRSPSAPREDLFQASIPPSIGFQDILGESTNFFFHNFIQINRRTGRSPVNHILSLRSQVNDNDLLAVGINCVGMAGLANQRKSATIMEAARLRYALAIHMVNTALRDPTQVASDQTLAVIILLGTFEVFKPYSGI